MWTVFKHTIKESIHRRMALVLLTVSLCFTVVMIWVARFGPGPKGSVIISNLGRAPQDAVTYVLDRYTMMMSLTSGLLFFIAMFAIAPLLTTYLEKGAAELLFAKGVARWHIFLGRVFGAYGVFLAAMLVFNLIPAAYFWVRAGIVPRYFLGGIGLLCVSFLGMLCLMALVSMFQNGVATIVTVGFLDLIISSVFLSRKAWYQLLPYDFMRTSMDVGYQVLPKHEELSRMATRFVVMGNVDSWTPLWTTLAFCAAALIVAGWRMSRKSF